MPAPVPSLSGASWRGAVVGGLVLVAQVAFALPAALAGENTRSRAPLALLAMFVGRDGCLSPPRDAAGPPARVIAIGLAAAVATGGSPGWPTWRRLDCAPPRRANSPPPHRAGTDG